MAEEIEHKFLVDPSAWKPQGLGMFYRQGYLSSAKERVVRVRVAGDKAFLTVKGPITGISRSEFEYAIPVEDAALILDQLCEKPLIEKTRHRETHDGRTWEIDVFHGANHGLVLAEIEVANATDTVVPPAWAVAEVSYDHRYLNTHLVIHPYTTWSPLEA